jgi:hypothetical protein
VRVHCAASWKRSGVAGRSSTQPPTSSGDCGSFWETPLAQLREMGMRGLTAVTDRYSWASYEKLICADVAQLASRKRGGGRSMLKTASLL